MTGAGPDGRGQPIDISVRISRESPAWPGDTPFSCGWTWERSRGQSVNVSELTMSPHVGTHADAPYHVESGWPTSDALPLEAFWGPVTVVDVPLRNGPLELADIGLGGRRVAGGRLLLKTGRSVASGTFPEYWPWLATGAVGDLLEAGLRLLGVDAPSVDAREATALAVHRALFSGGAYILENLDLRHVAAGEYHLTALPLCLHGLDAAPVRAVLHRLSGE